SNPPAHETRPSSTWERCRPCEGSGAYRGNVAYRSCVLGVTSGRWPRSVSGLSLGSVGLPGQRDQELYDLEVSKLRNFAVLTLDDPTVCGKHAGHGRIPLQLAGSHLQSWGGSGAGHTTERKRA